MFEKQKQKGKEMNERGKLGKEGEDRACAYLETCGYRIVERNFRCRSGEIDIVAAEERGGVICFVEVKTRRGCAFGLPKEAVDRRKQRKLCAAAKYYMLCHREYENCLLRMDVVEMLHLASGIYVNHIKGAFGEVS